MRQNTPNLRPSLSLPFSTSTLVYLLSLSLSTALPSGCLDWPTAAAVLFVSRSPAAAGSGRGGRGGAGRGGGTLPTPGPVSSSRVFHPSRGQEQSPGTERLDGKAGRAAGDVKSRASVLPNAKMPNSNPGPVSGLGKISIYPSNGTGENGRAGPDQASGDRTTGQAGQGNRRVAYDELCFKELTGNTLLPPHVSAPLVDTCPTLQKILYCQCEIPTSAMTPTRNHDTGRTPTPMTLYTYPSGESPGAHP
ncbi:unnamed protein product [Calypogeia fissa]